MGAPKQLVQLKFAVGAPTSFRDSTVLGLLRHQAPEMAQPPWRMVFNREPQVPGLLPQKESKNKSGGTATIQLITLLPERGFLHLCPELLRFTQKEVLAVTRMPPCSANR